MKRLKLIITGLLGDFQVKEGTHLLIVILKSIYCIFLTPMILYLFLDKNLKSTILEIRKAGIIKKALIHISFAFWSFITWLFILHSI